MWINSHWECILPLTLTLSFHPSNNPRNVKVLWDYFSRLREMEISPEKYDRYLQGIMGSLGTEKVAEGWLEMHLELSKVFAEYMALRKSEGLVIDLVDQLEMLSQWSQTPQGGKFFDKFRYVLLDDLQDCTPRQFRLLKKVVAGKSFLASGDDDQSIFGYRGASQTIFRTFMETFPKAEVVTFRNNHRCSVPILEASRRLISHNPSRMESSLGIPKESVNVYPVSKTSDPPGVFHWSFLTQAEEEESVAAKIQRLLSEAEAAGEALPSIGVLLRTNTDLERVTQRLAKLGIPVKFSGLFFNSPEIRLLTSFLQSLAFPSDSQPLYSLLTSSLYSLPPSDLALLTEMHFKSQIPLREVLKRIVRGEESLFNFSEASIETCNKVMLDLEHFESLMTRLTTVELIYSFLTETHILDSLLHPKTALAEEQVRSFV